MHHDYVHHECAIIDVHSSRLLTPVTWKAWLIVASQYCGYIAAHSIGWSRSMTKEEATITLLRTLIVQVIAD